MSTEALTGFGASRRRDTVLAAIETFRALDPGINMSNILVFLYVAENEGISVTELATISGLKKPTASRSIRALTPRGSRWALSPYLGLVELCAQGPARNSKTIRLTRQGRDLCARIDRLIANPVRICAGEGLDISQPDVSGALARLGGAEGDRHDRTGRHADPARAPQLSAPNAPGASAACQFPLPGDRSRAAAL
jgi:DNA-binding MarR family transcriptional regulator